MLKRLNLEIVGEGQHRSGWPYCMDALQPLFSSDAPVLFDDFIERTFLYAKRKDGIPGHRQPWVGVMHHPPDMPEWYLPDLLLQVLPQIDGWRQSEPHLRMIITLGANLQEWCQQTWPTIPSVVIKHPTGQPLLYWSLQQFMAPAKPRVIQVGWFLRNMLGIYQVRLSPLFHKQHLIQKTQMVRHTTGRCRDAYAKSHPERGNHGEVEQLTAVDDLAFDVAMASSVVFMEVISAVANNTVVECIARNTPICINRHPGPLAYLGPDYPLFYERLEDVEKLLTVENILAAHKYLCRMDKWWLQGDMFREQVRAACLRHVPECCDAGDNVFDGSLP